MYPYFRRLFIKTIISDQTLTGSDISKYRNALHYSMTVYMR